MTLKELRISKHLSQIDAAHLLNISRRTYQNYENDEEWLDTVKYKMIYQKLSNYESALNSIETNSTFYTHVLVKNKLIHFIDSVKNYKKRTCYSILKNYIDSDIYNKVCILYGLRRTGKTTLLFQIMSELPLDKIAYIKVNSKDDMAKISKDLNLLYEQGYLYIFIDEITLLDDFIDTAAILSDVYCGMGMKIVLSGTDSLGFAIAKRNELYDRTITIHTSYISFKEYAFLLDNYSIDEYIEYGGTLRKENMSYDDPDRLKEEVCFYDDETTRKYIDTSISKNIQHALKTSEGGNYFYKLRELYDQNELTNVIHRIVEDLNHQFLLRTINETFHSHDLGSAKNLLLHDAPKEDAYVLYEVDQNKIIERLKNIIEIKEQQESKVKITEEALIQIKQYLEELDLIYPYTILYDNGTREEKYLFTQPGMRYAITKSLVYSLKQDEYFQSLKKQTKDIVINKILEDIKGRLLEEIVLYNVLKSLQKDQNICQYRFSQGGEYDMIIYTPHTCSLYEIKHSDKINEQQTKHLKNEDKCKIIEYSYGSIEERIVLYRGKTKTMDGIQYQNIEEYLKSL